MPAIGSRSRWVKLSTLQVSTSALGVPFWAGKVTIFTPILVFYHERSATTVSSPSEEASNNIG